MISKGMEFDGWGGLVLSLHSPPILWCVFLCGRGWTTERYVSQAPLQLEF